MPLLLTRCSASFAITLRVGLVLMSAPAVTSLTKAQDFANASFAKWLKPMDWKRDSDQPVFRIGEKGQFDDMHILSPSVIYEAGEYWMYYMGSPNDVIAKGLYKPATA